VKRRKKQRFRSSSGNVCQLTLVGSRGLLDVVDAHWRYPSTAQDKREVESWILACGAKEVHGVTIEDPAARMAYLHNALYGGSDN